MIICIRIPLQDQRHGQHSDNDREDRQLERKLVVCKTRLEAALMYQVKRKDAGHVSLLLPEESDCTSDTQIICTDMSMLVRILLGLQYVGSSEPQASYHVALSEGYWVVELLQLDGCDEFNAVVPLLQRYESIINPKIQIVCGALGLTALNLAMAYSVAAAGKDVNGHKVGNPAPVAEYRTHGSAPHGSATHGSATHGSATHGSGALSSSVAGPVDGTGLHELPFLNAYVEERKFRKREHEQAIGSREAQWESVLRVREHTSPNSNALPVVTSATQEPDRTTASPSPAAPAAEKDFRFREGECYRRDDPHERTQKRSQFDGYVPLPKNIRSGVFGRERERELRRAQLQSHRNRQRRNYDELHRREAGLDGEDRDRGGRDWRPPAPTDSPGNYSYRGGDYHRNDSRRNHGYHGNDSNHGYHVNDSDRGNYGPDGNGRRHAYGSGDLMDGDEASMRTGRRHVPDEKTRVSDEEYIMSETEVEQLGSPRFIRTGNHRAALPEGLSPNSPDPDSFDENDLSLLVERLGKPLSYASIGYWNDELVKIAYEEERRSIQLHYLDPAEAGDWSRDRVKRAINAAISLLEDDQLATRLNWMFVCPNHTYAETVRTRFAAYANSANLVAQRQLFVHMVTEDSGPQAILNLFLRQRHPGRRGARDLTITSHTLLQSAPYFFPQDVDVVIDMGLQTVSTKFPWNNQLQYNITSQLTSDDLLTRTAAAGRFSGRRLTRLANGRRKEGDDVDVEYFVCASEDMISDSTSTVGSPSSANASLIIPSLLMSLLRPSTGGNIDKNVGGEVMDGVGSIYGKLVLPKLPFAPVVEGVLQLLANTGCVNGIGGLVETRCYNFMGWLGLLEDEWLAALMTNSEEAGCVGEAAAISAMLLKCPHPFEETRSGVSKIDRLRLNQLYFAVSEGDFMTLGNVLFEFSQHDQQWCRSHGLKWQQLTDAQMYHCQLVEFYKSKTGAKVPSNALEIAKVLTNTFLPSMAELRADNEYRLIRHTLFPGMKNNLPCSNEDIVIHLAQDSVAHVQPCLPSKITFWKGVADGTILSSEVGVSKRMDMSDSLKWPVFVSHYHRVGA